MGKILTPQDFTNIKKSKSDEEVKANYPDITRHTVKLIRNGSLTFNQWRAALKSEFAKFLSSGRTEKEIYQKFNSNGLSLLEKKIEGYDLFEQRNISDQSIYMLLPEIPDEEIRIKPRIWQYRLGVSQEGIPQPYICVQIPRSIFLDRGKLIIAPLYDVHYGHIAHKRKKFLSYIRWIKDNPNVFAIIGGDLMENALDDGRGYSYDQEFPPQIQVNELTRMLAEIAHKILFMLPGNHEWRTYRHTGIDPLMFVAQRLRVPYFDGPVYCTILGNSHRWRIYAFHGRTNSQTKGGKINAAAKPQKYTDFVHFILSGHVHDPIATPETVIAEDPINCRLVYPKQWIVIAPSFLRWEGSYAYRAEFRPPGSGGVSLEMSYDGDYRAVQK